MRPYDPTSYNAPVQQQWTPQSQPGQPGPTYGATQPNFSSYDYSTPAGGLQAGADYANYWANQNQNINRPNQVNPFGAQQWTVDQYGRPQLTTSVSPNQGMINAQTEERDIALGQVGQGLLGGIGQSLSSPYSYSGFQNQLPGQGDFAGERQRIEDQLYSGFETRMEPRFQQEREALDQRLADQGIPPGSELYSRMHDQLSQRQADARIAAQTQASVLGGNEQQRLFEMGMGARQQEIGEYGQQRYGGLTDLGALAGQQRGFVSPAFQQQQQVALPQLDPGAYGFGYQGLAQALEIAKMQDATSRYLASLGKTGGGGGDAGPGFTNADIGLAGSIF